MCNVKLHTEFSEVLIVELSSIVGDDSMRQPESVDDGFLDEVLHFALNDLGQRFDLHPLSEIVDCDHYELSLTGCRRKRTKYVDSPLSERPGCNN